MDQLTFRLASSMNKRSLTATLVEQVSHERQREQQLQLLQHAPPCASRASRVRSEPSLWVDLIEGSWQELMYMRCPRVVARSRQKREHSGIWHRRLAILHATSAAREQQLGTACRRTCEHLQDQGKRGCYRRSCPRVYSSSLESR